MEAELSGKETHGFIRLKGIKKEMDNGNLNTKSGPIIIVKNLGPFLSIDAGNRPGYIILYKSLDYSIKKAKDLGISAVSIKNVGSSSGYISLYARIAVNKNLILIGMNSSPAWVVPFDTT